MADKDEFELNSSVAQHPATAGNKVAMYHDAAEDASGGGAFSDVLDLIRDAQQFVFIADWSFHPLAVLKTNTECIGKLLVQKARSGRGSGFVAAIHTWNHNLVVADPENNQGSAILIDLCGGVRLPNLLWRENTRTGEGSAKTAGTGGFGWSLHQKFIVVDSPGPKGRRSLTAFCGGLDLTRGRLDWPSHPNLPDNPTLKWMLNPKQYPRGDNKPWVHDEWYNSEFGPIEGIYDLPRQAWHDVYLKINGPAAWAFLREFVGRWLADPLGITQLKEGPDYQKNNGFVREKFRSLFNRNGMLQEWEQSYPNGPWQSQVVRSLTRDQWTTEKIPAPGLGGKMQAQLEWRPAVQSEASIQAAYVQMIEKAKRFVYIETQYLIGSGNKWGRPQVENQIPQKLVEKIIEKINSSDPFHVYIVVPLFPEGKPSGTTNGIRYLQTRTIEYMISAVAAAAGRSWVQYLSFYFLAQWSDNKPLLQGSRDQRVRAAKRYMIYVHSKMMICDDQALIIGSANLNERSLAGGRDAEVCAQLFPASSQAVACQAQVQQFRGAIWDEHLRTPGDRDSKDSALRQVPWKMPESKECAFKVQSLATENYLNFRRGEARSTSGHLCRWPFDLDLNGKLVWQYIKGAKNWGELQKAVGDVLVPDASVKAFARTSKIIEEAMNSAWCLIPAKPAGIETEAASLFDFFE